MVLLIMIKSATSVYDSPNVAYYCGNTYPWFYTNSSEQGHFRDSASPFHCVKRPPTCDVRNYYKGSESFTFNNSLVTVSTQYGYILSGASSGASSNPFYTYTIGDNSAFYSVQTYHTKYDNPSLPLCGILQRITYSPVPSILVIAPVVSTDPQLTARANQLRNFILDYSLTGCGYDFSYSVKLFESQSALEDYCSDKHYDDHGYKDGKVAFAIVLNSADVLRRQWDYSIRVNYTSPFDQSAHTVACLYGCSFTYTVPSTKFYTQDLFKPQSAEFLYGYTYSGFSTLQLTVDEFIFSFYGQQQQQQQPQDQNQQMGRRQLLDAESGRISPSSQQEAETEAEADAELADSASAEKAAGSGLGAPTNYPGRVRVMASVGLMPTESYKTDDFQYVISSTLGIFYMLSFLYPVSRIVRALVLEKETRIKEGKRYLTHVFSCLFYAFSLPD